MSARQPQFGEHPHMMTRREIIMHNFRLYRPIYRNKTPQQRKLLREHHRLPFFIQAFAAAIPEIQRFQRELGARNALETSPGRLIQAQTKGGG